MLWRQPATQNITTQIALSCVTHRGSFTDSWFCQLSIVLMCDVSTDVGSSYCALLSAIYSSLTRYRLLAPVTPAATSRRGYHVIETERCFSPPHILISPPVLESS